MLTYKTLGIKITLPLDILDEKQTKNCLWLSVRVLTDKENWDHSRYFKQKGFNRGTYDRDEEEVRRPRGDDKAIWRFV